MPETIKNDLKLRSEEMYEIVSDIPGWLGRRGISLIGFVFICFLTLSWFVRYPDVIAATITITTTPPPITLVSRVSGRIQLLKPENASVNRGELIGYIHSNASVRDVLSFDSALHHAQSMATRDASLGELEASHTTYVNSLRELHSFVDQKLYLNQIRKLEQQENAYVRLGRTILMQIHLKKKELKLATERFQRDSILFMQGVFSKQDYSNSETTYIQQLRAYREVESSQISNEIQITSIRKQVGELQAAQQQDSCQVNTNVRNARREFLAHIGSWKENYLFLAPIAGNVTYLRFMEDDVHIEQGKELFSLIPNARKIYAQALLPISGSGKVSHGQRVNIKLQNYPYKQFGMLQGHVVSISELPSDQHYLVKVEVPADLKTTVGKKLLFKQQLQGDCEIITEDLSVLERVFYEFRDLLTAH